MRRFDQPSVLYFLVRASVLLVFCGLDAAFANDRPVTPPVAFATTEPYRFFRIIDGKEGESHRSPFNRDGTRLVRATRDGRGVQVWNPDELPPLTDVLSQQDLEFYGVSADGSTVFTTSGG